MEKRKITELKPHELNSKIYKDTFDEDFLSDIKEHGILTPLIITDNNVIISGHRRYEAAKALNFSDIPVIVSDLTDDLDIQAAVIRANKQRIKTNEQMGREYKILLEIEKEKANRRQATSTGGANPQLSLGKIFHKLEKQVNPGI